MEPCRDRFHGVDESMLKTKLDRLTSRKVEQLLNARLGTEADKITGPPDARGTARRKRTRQVNTN